MQFEGEVKKSMARSTMRWDVGRTRPVADACGPPLLQTGDVVISARKACLHAINFALDQALRFIEFMRLAFPNLAQLQLGAYSLKSLIIEVRWSTLWALTEGHDYLQLA